jgi:hypothetical protein
LFNCPSSVTKMSVCALPTNSNSAQHELDLSEVSVCFARHASARTKLAWGSELQCALRDAKGRRAETAPNVLATTTVKDGNFLPQFKKAAWGKGRAGQDPDREGSRKHALERKDLQLLRRMSLTTRNALVDQDFDLDSTVLSSSRLGLVRCHGSVFAHCAGRHDMPHWHTTLLHQESNYRFRALLT